MRTVGLISVLASAAGVGPIQKVLTLLDDLKSKVNAEGEVEGEQFAKYSKWCEDENVERNHSIETGTNKAGDLNAEIEDLTAQIGSLGEQIASLNAALTQNEGDLKKANQIRDAEHAEFKQADKDLVDTVDTLVRASSIIRRGAGSDGSAGTAAKLQAALSQVAATLSTVMDAAVVSTHDKRRLSALLEASSEDGPSGAPTAAAYESHSNGIIDLLAELKVKAEQELSDLRKDEMERKHNFEMLAQSLTDQINTQSRDQKNSVTSKASKEEALGVAQGDLADTNKNLSADKKYVSDLNQMCAAKSSEWDARKQSRAEELTALNKAIEILSGDKFTAAAGRRLPSLLQVQARRAPTDARQQVAALLQSAAKNANDVELAQLAMRLRVGDDPFGKVRGLITNMINKLQTEAAEEQDHNAWCVEEKAESTKKREEFTNKVEDQTTRINKATAGVNTLKEEIATLSGEVAAADKAMAEATQIRNDEHSEFNAAIADYEQGQESITAAISVLQDHYAANPALLQAPTFAGPVFAGSYEKKVDGATGIIGILEVAASDFARMEAEARASENADSKAFTKMKNENDVTRATKTTSIKSKSAEVTRVNNLINDLKNDRTSSQSELDAVMAYLDKLKASCEFKPMSFEERAARRQQEIASLKNAVEILGDVPAMFLQRN
jgi:hypothetical protein